MKAFRILAALLLSASLLTVAVSAATDFTPSVVEKSAEFVSTETDENGDPVVGYVTDADGNVVGSVAITSMSITPLSDADAASDEIGAALANSVDYLNNNNLDDSTVPGIEAAWEEATDGAPMENAVVAHVFDVSFDGEIPEGCSISFTIKDPGIAEDAPLLILHNYADGEWEIVPCVRNADGSITITVSSFSPFVIITDSSKAPAVDANAPKSPSTGIEETVNYIPALIVVAVAGLGAAVAVKASKRTAK